MLKMENIEEEEMSSNPEEIPKGLDDDFLEEFEKDLLEQDRLYELRLQEEQKIRKRFGQSVAEQKKRYEDYSLPDLFEREFKTPSQLSVFQEECEPQLTLAVKQDCSVSKVVQAALDVELENLMDAVEGERNDQLNKSSYILAKNSPYTGITEDDVLNNLGQAAEDIGLDVYEIDRTIMSGFRAGLRDAPEVKPVEDLHKYTEFGDARYFSELHKNNVKNTNNGWYCWDGKKWVFDPKGLGVRQFTDSIYLHYTALLSSTNEKKMVMDAIRRTTTNAHRTKVLNLVQHQPEILVKESEFDKNLHHFNVRNGTINLKTLQLQSHNSADLITKIADVDYDPEAKCPNFDRFLRQIFQSDEEVISYVQKIVGHALTGKPIEQKGYIFKGKGGNGKGVFVQTILGVVGDYGKEFDSKVLTTKTNELVALSQMAQLKGIRFAFGSELPLGSYLDESLFKKITGGDNIDAKKLYNDIGSIKPQFTLYIQGNHLPKFVGGDEGIKRRMRVITFPLDATNQVDTNLVEKLATEKSGVLNWLLNGLAANPNGEIVKMPKKVELSTVAYINESNIIQNFIDEHCVKDITANHTTLREMYGAFQTWCQNTGNPSLSIIDFGNQLGYMGYEKYKKNSAWFWKGIKLK